MAKIPSDARVQSVDDVALWIAAGQPEPRSAYQILVHAIDHLQATPTPGYSHATCLLSRCLRCVSAQMDLASFVQDLRPGSRA